MVKRRPFLRSQWSTRLCPVLLSELMKYTQTLLLRGLPSFWHPEGLGTTARGDDMEVEGGVHRPNWVKTWFWLLVCHLFPYATGRMDACTVNTLGL